MPEQAGFTHIDEHGHARMVNVTLKSVTQRTAVAHASVVCSRDTESALTPSALLDAKLAGIQAAKQTQLLIPLCHPIPIDDVEIKMSCDNRAISIEATSKANWKTGVEMEALTAASISALALVSLLKSSDPLVRIEDIAVWSKEGGKSGKWTRPQIPSA